MTGVPKMKWEMTPMQVLQVIVIIVGLAVIFQEVRSGQLTNARDIQALTTALEQERTARSAALRDLDTITRANQLAITRAQSDQSNIIAGLARIEARLDRIEPYRVRTEGGEP